MPNSYHQSALPGSCQATTHDPPVDAEYGAGTAELAGDEEGTAIADIFANSCGVFSDYPISSAVHLGLSDCRCMIMWSLMICMNREMTIIPFDGQ